MGEIVFFSTSKTYDCKRINTLIFLSTMFITSCSLQKKIDCSDILVPYIETFKTETGINFIHTDIYLAEFPSVTTDDPFDAVVPITETIDRHQIKADLTGDITGTKGTLYISLKFIPLDTMVPVITNTLGEIITGTQLEGKPYIIVFEYNPYDTLTVSYEHATYRHSVGTCYGGVGVNNIVIDVKFWRDTETTETKKKLLLWHELGHCLFAFKHDDTILEDGCPTNIMNSGAEVFTVECIEAHQEEYFSKYIEQTKGKNVF